MLQRSGRLRDSPPIPDSVGLSHNAGESTVVEPKTLCWSTEARIALYGMAGGGFVNWGLAS
jgi:hypothetical protein